MNKLCLTFLFCILLIPLAFSQEGEEGGKTLGAIINDLTLQWDLEADNMNDYEGLSKFCQDEKYRLEVINLLQDIHHYDSVLYDRLTKAARFNSTHEIKKTIAEIEKFEEGYDMKSFIHFLHEECNARNDLERHAEEAKDDIGIYSYDGQVYILENELNKFVSHITKRVDHIREHVHHLHIK